MLPWRPPPAPPFFFLSASYHLSLVPFSQRGHVCVSAFVCWLLNESSKWKEELWESQVCSFLHFCLQTSVPPPISFKLMSSVFIFIMITIYPAANLPYSSTFRQAQIIVSTTVNTSNKDWASWVSDTTRKTGLRQHVNKPVTGRHNNEALNVFSLSLQLYCSSCSFLLFQASEDSRAHILFLFVFTLRTNFCTNQRLNISTGAFFFFLMPTRHMFLCISLHFESFRNNTAPDHSFEFISVFL